MNKATKILVGAGAFLVMSGGLLALTGRVAGADTQAMGLRSSKNIHVEESAPVDNPIGSGNIYEDYLEPFTKLDVDIALGDITVMAGDRYSVNLNWDGGLYRLNYELEDGTLKVWGSGSSNLDAIKLSATVDICLPADASLEQADIHTSLGDINLYDMTVQELDVTNDLGDINGMDLMADDLEVECSLGDIWLDDVTAGTAEVTDSMGDIATANLTVLESLQVKDNMGNINLQGDMQGELDIEASMGNVDLYLDEDASYYSYDLQVSMGDLRVDGEEFHKTASRTGGTSHLEIENHMGDIWVQFGQG